MKKQIRKLSSNLLRFLPADGRSEYRVQKTQAGSVLAVQVLFDDELESLVVVGERGMLHLEMEYFSSGWPKFGFKISEIKNDLLLDDDDDNDFCGWRETREEDDDRDDVESGEER